MTTFYICRHGQTDIADLVHNAHDFVAKFDYEDGVRSFEEVL